MEFKTDLMISHGDESCGVLRLHGASVVWESRN